MCGVCVSVCAEMKYVMVNHVVWDDVCVCACVCVCVCVCVGVCGCVFTCDHTCTNVCHSDCTVEWCMYTRLLKYVSPI